MRTFVFLTKKNWHLPLFEELSKRPNEQWIHISNRTDFTFESLSDLRPEMIFIPHWSYIIPESIWSKYDCVVFHMTDLPYGRGGSPLQNLIVRGHQNTMISAIKVDRGLDTGHIYLKEPLSLSGSAQEIFERSAPVIGKMIKNIIDNGIEPVPQKGDPVVFKRRKPADGRMNELADLDKVYNYIRMLDADGYPSAFIETEHFVIKFKDAKKVVDSEVQANVRIIKK